jgi:hypothetical protein
MDLLRADLAIVALLVLLPSCAVPPPPQVPDSPGDFRAVQPPPAGQSRIYFFRPALSFAGRKQDTPTGHVDSAQAFVLAHGTFTSLLISPGRHALSLIPGEHDASLWRSEFQFDVDADRVYFVAVWLDLEVKERRRFMTIPTGPGGPAFLEFIPIPLPAPRIPGPADVIVGATQVRIEVVSEEDAKRGLYGARYLAPTTVASPENTQ